MNVVILAGGLGKRLKTLSRDGLPKPFIKTKWGLSLLQHTIRRALEIKDINKIFVSVNQDFICQAIEDCQEVDNNMAEIEIITEPVAQDTTVAITAIAHYLYHKNHLSSILFLPCDHIINNMSYFVQSIAQAQRKCDSKIHLFGINPTKVNRDYGHIYENEAGGVVFIEKPSLDSLYQLSKTRQLFWNAGIIYAPPRLLLSEIKSQIGMQYDLITANIKNTNSLQKQYMIRQLPKNKITHNLFRSIDYDVLEKSPNLSIVKCDFDWIDVGNYTNFIETCSHASHG